MALRLRKFGFLTVLIAATCPMVGCSDDVMEVETPSGELEVEEELDGDIEAELEE